MHTYSHHKTITHRELSGSGVSYWHLFMDWCKGQEENRLGWLGAGLMIHGCIVTPVTFMVIALSGLNFFFLVPAMLAMIAVLVVNLAAMPAKITLPVLAASFLLDLSLLAACVISGFSI